MTESEYFFWEILRDVAVNAFGQTREPLFHT
jgi:hypothetical protein